MKQIRKNKVFLLTCVIFGLLSLFIFISPVKVFAGCTDDSQCNSGEVCNTSTGACVVCLTNSDCGTGKACVANSCISDPQGKCSARQFPCAYGCDPSTGACLTQSGGAQPAKGVKGDPCVGDSDCGAGLACDIKNTPHTCQVPPSTEPPIPGSPAPPPNQPAVTIPTLPAPACFQGTCPTGLCSTNGLCLPPNQYKTGIASSNSLTEFLLNVIKILLSFAGIVAVVMLVLGGYWYMAAGGNEEMAEKGRNTILNFVLGLVVIILAYTIVTVISSTLTGADKLLK
jgi:type IV secretory pathway VirB2 component (pilin)